MPSGYHTIAGTGFVQMTIGLPLSDACGMIERHNGKKATT